MPNAQDLAFVQQATASGLAEVSKGQVAIAKSLNPAVRNFGQQMVTERTAANNQLSAIAAQEHIPQSPMLTGAQQQDIVTLEIRGSTLTVSAIRSFHAYNNLGR